MASIYKIAGCGPRTHQIKAECELYAPLFSRLKNFEVRKTTKIIK